MTGDSMSFREKIEKFEETLSELESSLEDVVGRARDASREADRLGLPAWVSGQLEMYLARNVEQFVEEMHQAGSIASIRASLAEEAGVEEISEEAEKE